MDLHTIEADAWAFAEEDIKEAMDWALTAVNHNTYWTGSDDSQRFLLAQMYLQQKNFHMTRLINEFGISEE